MSEVKEKGSYKDVEPTIQYEAVDWTTIGKKQDAYNASEKTRLEEIYSKTITNIAEHEVVEGTIVAKNEKEVLVRIGYKSDGVVQLNEFRYNPNLQVGDTVEVYIEKQEDKEGQLLLSHKKARIVKGWDRMNAALESQEIVNGFIK